MTRRRESPEKREERWVMDCLLKAGCRVYKFSQPRHTMQTEGIPDLWVFVPRRQLGFWFEVKAGKNQLTLEQQRFRDLCGQTGVRHYWGGLEQAREVLAELRLTWDPNETLALARPRQ